jgi:hypothetical protein
MSGGSGVFYWTNAMTEVIQEFVDSRGVKLAVDREAGFIRGVKILGLESKNGRTYPKETAARAVPLYEGSRVNIDHPKGSPSSPRDYASRIGSLVNVRVEHGDGGLRGDFHFNPKHALAEQLIWDAEHAPENVGFSHNVEAKTSRRDGRVIVEEITRVQSVDLVADPATTRGLFEHHEPHGKESTVDYKEITEAELRASRPDMIAAITKHVMSEHANSEAEKAKDAKISALEAENKAIKESAEKAERSATIAKELTEAKLPESAITDVFRAQLSEAKDADARKLLIEDRRKLCGTATGKPQSKEQINAVSEGLAAVTDAKSFLSAITE